MWKNLKAWLAPISWLDFAHALCIALEKSS